MSLFRAMNGKLTALKRTTLESLEKYLTSKWEFQEEFAGISLEDLSLVEEIFALSACVYRLELAGNTTTEYLVKNYQWRSETKLYLPMEDKHCCWIKKYECTQHLTSSVLQ